MFEFGRHVVSFVLVRGSVPLFWSQPGVKYRPPPQLDRGEEETQIAFRKHFEQQLELYGKQVRIQGSFFTEKITPNRSNKLIYRH